MAKDDLVRVVDWAPPGVIDGRANAWEGSLLIVGSTPGNRISVEDLAGLSPRLGHVRAGTFQVGGDTTSHIIMTDDPHKLGLSEAGPRAMRAMRNKQGQTVLMEDAESDAIWTVGLAPVGGVQPIRMLQDGSIVIQNGSIEMLAIARTFLQAGVIDLTTGGSYDAAGATGIRLKAGWGIQSKRAGTVSAFWDADTGQFKAGDQSYPTVLDDRGIFSYIREFVEEGYRFRYNAGGYDGVVAALTAVAGSTYGGYVEVDLLSGRMPHPSLAVAYTIVGAICPSDQTSFSSLSFTAAANSSTGSEALLKTDTFKVEQPRGSATTQPYLADFEGVVRSEAFYSGKIQGALHLLESLHGITNTARAALDAGALSIMVDDSGDYWLCINSEGAYYKVEMTRV